MPHSAPWCHRRSCEVPCGWTGWRVSPRLTGLGILSLLCLIGPAIALPADDADSARHARSFLAKHCLQCHGPDRQEGELSLAGLSTDFAHAVTRDRWQAIHRRVQAGEMPPAKQPRPQPDELRTFSAWIAGQIHQVDARRRAAEGRVVFRRLNKFEYQNTLRDLLGIDLSLQEMLPADASAEGFDNVGEALHISSFLMERYLEAADFALSRALVNRAQPPVKIQRRIGLKETHQVRSTTEKVFRKTDDDTRVVMFSSSLWQAVMLSPFYPQERGQYRFRISAAGVQSDGQPVVFRVLSGVGGMAGPKPRLIGYFDAPADRSTVIEFVDHLEPRTTISILPYGLAAAQTVNKVGEAQWTGPGLAIDWVEVEGPLSDAWPPASHTRLVENLPWRPAPIFNQRDRVEITSPHPHEDAGRILQTFARKAFRRTVTPAEIDPYLRLVNAKLAEEASFEQALRVGLMAILTSPQFLFLREEPGKLDDFALASRLSYFLWSSCPDDTLLSLAEQKKLADPAVLRTQVDRLLADPKSQRFTENFVGQWLGLRDLDFTIPSHILYPEFDDMLKVSMLRETELFFHEVLQHDLSLTNFVDSDFTMLNGRLAKHYGIPGVHGWEFRKVPLPAESHRGGVLTMASVLKVTANGTLTSPVTRGAWVLERILGTPAPKPPANVSALEPDIRGATTIRQQLAKHRQLASCASCHVSIDPPGFALESFDVIGGYREFYRTSGNGKPVLIDGKRMPYLQGPPVDPADVLPNGKSFRNSDELKLLLLEDQDQLARALAAKLLTYATGGPPEPLDRPALDHIVARIRPHHYGLRTLIHELVQSDLFRQK